MGKLGGEIAHLVDNSATERNSSQSPGKLGACEIPSHAPNITAVIFSLKTLSSQPKRFAPGAESRQWEVVGVRDAEVQDPLWTGLMPPEVSLTTITTEDYPLEFPIARVSASEDLVTGIPALESPTVKAWQGTAAAARRVLTRTPRSWQLRRRSRWGRGCCSGRSPCSRRAGEGGGMPVCKVETFRTGSWIFSREVSTT